MIGSSSRTQQPKQSTGLSNPSQQIAPPQRAMSLNYSTLRNKQKQTFFQQPTAQPVKVINVNLNNTNTSNNNNNSSSNNNGRSSQGLRQVLQVVEAQRNQELKFNNQQNNILMNNNNSPAIAKGGDIKSGKTVIIKPKENSNDQSSISQVKPKLSNTVSNLSNLNKMLLPPIKQRHSERLLEERKGGKADESGQISQKQSPNDPEFLKLARFFRNRLASLIVGTGRKEYYLQFLASMKDLSTKLKIYQKSQLTGIEGQAEIVKRLKKIAATKAKYRYKERIDFERSTILRTLGYEARQLVQQMRENGAKRDEYQDLEDENDKEQDEIAKLRLERGMRREIITNEAITNWKRSRGCLNAKVFVIVGLYPDLKRQLISLGWQENPNEESLIFDLKWVTKKKDVNKDVLLESQITNHFQKNQCLTSKNGLALNLRNLIWHNQCDIDTFYPRCYDLSDIQEFQDFLEEFKMTQAESILKREAFKNQVQKQQQDNAQSEKNNNTSKGFIFQNALKYHRLKILLACAVIKRKTKSVESKLAMIKQNQLPVVTPEEWKILNLTDKNYNYLDENPEIFLKINQAITREMDSEDTNNPDLSLVCKKYLSVAESYDPQFELNLKNSWIVKPGGLSRGRGIRSFDQLDPLINYIVGKDVMWVAQKYMENPLTIHNKKFDIRQWVLVTEWNPLTIYFYDTCYIRVCFEEYNPTDLQNKFAHLANNCISKHAENFEEKVNDTMMHMDEFAEYVKTQENGKDMFYSKIQKQMKEIVINSIKSCKDSIEQRKNSFEVFGYDFMIDSKYNTWLIEINSSPSMEYSTAVTSKLVKMCMEDTAKMIDEHFARSEKKFKRDQEFGLWKNIYRENIGNYM